MGSGEPEEPEGPILLPPEMTARAAPAAPAAPAGPPPSSPWFPPRRPIEQGMRRWERWAAPAVVFLLALVVYQGVFADYGIGTSVEHPPIIIFDEAHYVKVARNYTNGVWIDPSWADPRPQNFEHPPLGKYLIALGIWFYGKPHNDYITAENPGQANQDYIQKMCGHDNPECAYDARGWRLLPTIVGASGIAAAYLLALRLFNRRSAGYLAALFLLLDGLYFMHARLALLDIFPTAFAIWGFAFALAPYRHGRWLGAVFYGLGLASKTYVLMLLPVFAFVMFVQTRPPRERTRPAPPPLSAAAVEAAPGLAPASAPPAADVRTLAPRVLEPTPAERFRTNVSHSWRKVRPWIVRGGLTVTLALLIPLAVYLASYAIYLYLWTKMDGVGFAIHEWVYVQIQAVTWDFAGKVDHPFKSPAWTWVGMYRPVYYYDYTFPDGRLGKMHSLGNPFLWWTTAIALVVVPARILARFFGGPTASLLRIETLERLALYRFSWTRDFSVFVGALLWWCAYLPWFTVQRILFLFYFVVAVPFFAVFAGGLVGEQWDRGGFPRILALGYVIVLASVFALYYPVYTGVPITREHYDWLRTLIPWSSW